MPQFTDWLVSPDLVASTIRLATPIAYASLGATLCERSGVINIALEGMLLSGAFTSVVATYYSSNVAIGFIGGLGGSVLLSALFGAFVLWASADQIIVGAALNMVVLGLFGYLSFVLFQTPGVTPTVPGINAVSIPGLGELPWVGEAFFHHSPTVLMLPFVMVLCHVLLFRTPLGLRMRAAGESPMVDEAAGVNVLRVRFSALLLSGLVVGLGGVNLGLETLKFYQDSMVAGRGFIALAANIFGGWSAVGGVAASLVFGFSQALMLRIQTVQIPQEFIFMLPYATTLVALLLARRRSIAPAALGQPFLRRK